MSYELTIIPGTQITLFCWSGPITLEDRKTNVERIKQFCSENDISQVIVDTRQQVRETSTTQDYEFGNWVNRKMRGFKFAVIRHSSDRYTQFYENVAANRGSNSRSFETLEEAQRWLNA